jgi:hypothetical protein
MGFAPVYSSYDPKHVHYNINGDNVQGFG